MKNECVEFLPTTKPKQKKRKLLPKTRELLRRAKDWKGLQ